MNEMELARDYVNQALSLRAKERIKIRQPLASVTVPKLGETMDFELILKDELNVKQVIIGSEVAIDTDLTPELVREGKMREVIRHVQAARKNAGLNVDDRIHLVLSSGDEELQQAIIEHKSTIMAETLALELADRGEPAYIATVQIDGSSLTVGLEKA